MAWFSKKKKVIEVGGKKIELEPKPSRIGFLGFGRKPRAQQAAQPTPQPQIKVPQPEQKINFNLPFSKNQEPQAGAAPQQKPAQQPASGELQVPQPKLEIPKLVVPKVQQERQRPPAVPAGKRQTGNFLDNYLAGALAGQKNLPNLLREEGIAGTPLQFVRRMFTAALMIATVITVVFAALLSIAGVDILETVVLAVMMGVASYGIAFNLFLQYPAAKRARSAKIIERDILFAARDMIISLRSGMPLFDAIKAVSTGYGDASKEFSKIVEKAQFRVPLDEAIDSTISESKSPSFKKIMLQASVSIRAGADVVAALQAVIDQLQQERIIELRAYGQKLNALAMFYMLFGVILPSMGIAVLTILTTFIAIFTVNTTLLGLMIAFIFIVQLVFLRLIVASRPVFAL